LEAEEQGNRFTWILPLNGWCFTA